MDEFQFIESLDALLASEAMDEAAGAAGELGNSSPNGPMVLSYNTPASSVPLQGQGLLMGTTGLATIAGTSAGTTVGNNASSNWLGANDGSNNNSNGNRSHCSQNPFAMPMQSTPSLAPISAAPSIAPAHPYQHFYMEQNQTRSTSLASMTTNASGMNTSLNTSASTNTNDNTMTTVSGPTLSSALPTHPAGASVAAASNAQSLIPSGATSVCTANSRGSSTASSAKRRGSEKGIDEEDTKPLSRKRSRTSTAVSESEDESFRRRHDRNLREQRRSQKITHQIDQLREVLAAASVRFKPDKFSTLVSVVEYVKQLQERSAMLDSEHKKLLDTITRTNEMVNEPYLANSGASTSSAIGSSGNSNGGIGAGIDAAQPDPTVSGNSSVPGNGNLNGVAGSPNDIYNEDELVFVRNVDYKCIFERCGMPLAVASIDGRLIDCNEEFVKVTGYRRQELLPVEQQQQQQQQQQQESIVIAEEVGSSYLPVAVFPDGQAVVNDGKKSSSMTIQQDSNVHLGNNLGSAKAAGNATTIRNFSLFNLLSRNHMEEVFVSLSAMLKHPLKEEGGNGFVPTADHWSGNVRLSRNSHLEMRINVSLVRSPQGRAKFFDCSLTPLSTVPPG